MSLFPAQKKIRLAILGLAGLLALAWWIQSTFLGWYYWRQLNQADEQNREIWVKCLIGLDVAVQPQAMARLCSTDAAVYSSGQAVLAGLARTWGVQDSRCRNLLKGMQTHFSAFSEPGKNCALVVAAEAIQENLTSRADGELVKLAGALLQEGARETRCGAFTLAAILLHQGTETLEPAFFARLAEKGLASPDIEIRTRALHFLLNPSLKEDPNLLAKVVPLLGDASAAIRQSALLALGPHQGLVPDDDLLPLLHDTDPEVCRLCEVALRGRGLSDNHLLLARYISDPRPQARLQVLQTLGQVRDLDAGIWLKRLCQDPEPAVRAAAIRAASGQLPVDLHDLAQNDPSPTVRQLALYYLNPGRNR